jgi:MoaD family protein
MSIKVHIPTPLREQTGGQAVVEVSADTVKSALDALGERYPALTPKLFDNGQVKRFLNLFVNDEDVRYLDELATPVKDGDEISIIPAVAGG